MVTDGDNNRDETLLLTADEDPDLAFKYSKSKMEGGDRSTNSVNDDDVLRSDYDRDRVTGLDQ